MKTNDIAEGFQNAYYPCMQLDTYLEAEGVNLRDFAVRIGVANAGVVSKYANRHQIPRPPIMAAITRETKGAVQPNDFYPESAVAE